MENPNSEMVTYRSGTSEMLGPAWDIMQVIYSREEAGVTRLANSFVIARDDFGAIMRKVGSFPEKWEAVTDPDEYRGFQSRFDERKKLAAERAANARRVKPFALP